MKFHRERASREFPCRCRRCCRCGQRRPGRPARPSVVRINGRDFLRVDYDRPAPNYLNVWRSAFERAVTAHPDTYETLLAGSDGEASLRDIWQNAVAFGNLTWGGDAQDN